MSDFEWDGARHGLGLPTLDADHKAILKALRDMQQAHQLWPDSKTLPIQARSILVLVRSHFDREAALMRQVKYPQTARHEHQHSQLLQRITEYVERIEESNFVPREFFWFMANAIQSDMLEADGRLADFLHPKRGPDPAVPSEEDDEEDGEVFQRVCARCKSLSPKVRSSHSLFGRGFGWRVHRRMAGGVPQVEWLCGPCWAGTRQE